MSDLQEKLFSVSEYLEFLNEIFKKCKARVEGEVSGLNIGPTGHVYFSLKDEKDKSVLKCIIWKSKYQMCGLNLEDGMKIIANGSPNLHGQYGFSFVAETIELAGEGALKKEYDKLKQKLQEEGIFDESQKRSIPPFPQKIGLVTSKQGAVLADFLNNLGQFGFQIQMIDSRVEGQAATADLLASLKTFRKKDIDVLVVMRGGGDLESFLAFNNEMLVREISGFPVPVIAGIGHHKDEPLAAMAADLAVSTPTAAARALSHSFEEALLILEKQERRIIGSYQDVVQEAKLLINKGADIIKEAGYLILARYKKIENDLKLSIRFFEEALRAANLNIKNFSSGIFFNFTLASKKIEQKIAHAEQLISVYSPERQLRLGYSIASIGGKILRSVNNAVSGDVVNLKLSDGELKAKVTEIMQKNKII